MAVLAWMAALLGWGWLVWLAFVGLEAPMLGWGLLVGFAAIAMAAIHAIFWR